MENSEAMEADQSGEKGASRLIDTLGKKRPGEKGLGHVRHDIISALHEGGPGRTKLS